MMFVKKVKRKCGVRGCKNTETYAISRSREAGNSIIACKSCLEEGLEAIKDYANRPDPKKPPVTTPPPLFYNAAAIGKDADVSSSNTLPVVEDAEQLQNEGSGDEQRAEDEETADVFSCPACDRVFETERGLKMHLKSCEKQTNEE